VLFNLLAPYYETRIRRGILTALAGVPEANIRFLRLLQTINRSRKLFISSTTVRGNVILRAGVPSFRTHRADIEEVFETVTAEARRLGGIRA